MTDLWTYIKQAQKPIVLYGMGDGGDKILNVLKERSVKVEGVFASDNFVRGQSFHGWLVERYDQIKQRLGEMIVLVAFGTSRPEVIRQIRKIAAEQELYIPDVPVVGGGLFTKEYALDHEKELEWVYQRLGDRQSQWVFTQIIDYKLSGRMDRLFACETPPEEADENILKLSANERYLDLGAFTGDTVEWLLGRTGGRYDAIWAVEPDRRSFARLNSKLGGMANICCLNVGIGNRAEQRAFKDGGGRNSRCTKGGKLQLFSTIDAILAGQMVTYIKMDVEGQEKEAIFGGRETILRDKPKMLISCYHRVEDLFVIPREIFKIRDDYQLFMRHHPCLPAWDVNYYFR